MAKGFFGGDTLTEAGKGAIALGGLLVEALTPVAEASYSAVIAPCVRQVRQGLKALHDALTTSSIR